MIKVLFDTETTGLLVPKARSLTEQPEIVEIYCVKIDEDFNVLGDFESFYKPIKPLSEKLTAIHGISNEMLINEPTFKDRHEELAEFFTGVDTLIAHNLAFDRSMLANELLRIDKVLNFPWPRNHVCTVEKAMPIEQRRISLANLHKLVTGKPHEGAHRAKDDVHALVRCYHYLCEKGLC